MDDRPRSGFVADAYDAFRCGVDIDRNQCHAAGETPPECRDPFRPVLAPNNQALAPRKTFAVEVGGKTAGLRYQFPVRPDPGSQPIGVANGLLVPEGLRGVENFEQGIQGNVAPASDGHVPPIQAHDPRGPGVYLSSGGPPVCLITLIAVAIIDETSAIFAGRIIVLFCLASMPSFSTYCSATRNCTA